MLDIQQGQTSASSACVLEIWKTFSYEKLSRTPIQNSSKLDSTQAPFLIAPKHFMQDTCTVYLDSVCSRCKQCFFAEDRSRARTADLGDLLSALTLWKEWRAHRTEGAEHKARPHFLVWVTSPSFRFSVTMPCEYVPRVLSRIYYEDLLMQFRHRNTRKSWSRKSWNESSLAAQTSLFYRLN